MLLRNDKIYDAKNDKWIPSEMRQEFRIEQYVFPA